MELFAGISVSSAHVFDTVNLAECTYTKKVLLDVYSRGMTIRTEEISIAVNGTVKRAPSIFRFRMPLADLRAKDCCACVSPSCEDDRQLQDVTEEPLGFGVAWQT